MLVLATVLMLLDGVLYLTMGVCILTPVVCFPAGWRALVGGMYLSLFHDFTLLSGEQDEETGTDGQAEKDVPSGRVSERVHHDFSCHRESRMVAYLLIFLGVCRVITSFHWGCGYIILGLVSCLGEIALLCNELLRHETTTRLHRTMAVVLLNVAVSLLYIGCAFPHCRG